MDKVDVSVILPIYNIKEEYLRKCVGSLMRQTKEEIEIILVNDGSTNNAYDVCMDLQKQDQRIKVLTQENQGVSVARNQGMAAATGEWICFVDPDDWVDESYVEHLYKDAVAHDADISVCDFYIYYSDKKEIINRSLDSESTVLEKEEKNRLMYQLLNKKLIGYYPREMSAGMPWARIFRHEFIKKFDLSFVPGMARMQDVIFCLYAMENANKIYYSSDALYHYRMDNASASHKYNPRIVEYFEKYYYETEVFLKIYEKPKECFDAFRMKKLTSINSYLLNYFFHDDNPESKKERRKELAELLEEPEYKKALNAINRKYLRKSEYVFVLLLKHRCYRLLELSTKLRDRAKYR